MEDVKVSIFASAVRSRIWKSCLDSLKSTSVPFEVVFGGYCTEEEVAPFLKEYSFFKYVHTKNIKPAQVYEATRRFCKGETMLWFCDDADGNNDVIGKAYNYWKSQNNEKLILSIQTKESGYQNIDGTLFNMNIHRFVGGHQGTPLMAPLGMMSRKFLDEIGGFDRRFTCGQYENQTVMMAYERGAKVEIFGGPDCYIDIDHLGKSIAIGESTNDDDFRQRPFAKGYPHDRHILETSWVILLPNKQWLISQKQLDTFQPYEKDISLTKSESFNGGWE